MRERISHAHPYVAENNYRYMPIRQTLRSDDLGEYSTVGLQIVLVEETVLDVVSDVSTDFEEVRHLADLCTEQQISPKYILDVVRDFLDRETKVLSL